MKLSKMSLIGFLPFLLAPLFSCAENHAISSRFEFTKSDQGILVKEDGRDVLFYQMAPKSLNGEYTRTNYIHPLYGLDGAILTEDFPEDHYHQRGIFWAWHQLYADGRRMGDGWLLEDFDTPVISAEADAANSRLNTVVHWTSPKLTDENGKPLPYIEERLSLQFYPLQGDVRTLDFDLELTALSDSVYIGGSEDEKGYGGFSTRVKLPDGMLFKGEDGSVTPQNLQIDAGPWIDFTGKLGADSTLTGVTILSHKDNPGYPQKWILRPSKSMQNIVYPGREPVSLPKAEPLTLRYRLLIHRGSLSDSAIDKSLADFNAK